MQDASVDAPVAVGAGFGPFGRRCCAHRAGSPSRAAWCSSALVAMSIVSIVGRKLVLGTGAGRRRAAADVRGVRVGALLRLLPPHRAAT